MDKTLFERFPADGLIKSADLPTPGVQPDRKAKLNRKGNELFNEGDIEAARRLFQTTGYSDGLIRVGDKYLGEHKPIEALKMYRLARDEKRSEALIVTAALVIQNMLRENSEEATR
jgi:Rad3-related DNA helicase